PGATTSPLDAKHIEHPGSLQLNPASLKTESRPSDSAWRFTNCDPGTTQAETPCATLRPLATAAATRRSLILLLAQEPMKTCWIGVPAMAALATRPVYFRAAS